MTYRKSFPSLTYLLPIISILPLQAPKWKLILWSKLENRIYRIHTKSQIKLLKIFSIQCSPATPRMYAYTSSLSRWKQAWMRMTRVLSHAWQQKGMNYLHNEKCYSDDDSVYKRLKERKNYIMNYFKIARQIRMRMERKAEAWSIKHIFFLCIRCDNWEKLSKIWDIVISWINSSSWSRVSLCYNNPSRWSSEEIWYSKLNSRDCKLARSVWKCCRCVAFKISQKISWWMWKNGFIVMKFSV